MQNKIIENIYIYRENVSCRLCCVCVFFFYSVLCRLIYASDASVFVFHSYAFLCGSNPVETHGMALCIIEYRVLCTVSTRT